MAGTCPSHFCFIASIIRTGLGKTLPRAKVVTLDLANEDIASLSVQCIARCKVVTLDLALEKTSLSLGNRVRTRLEKTSPSALLFYNDTHGTACSCYHAHCSFYCCRVEVRHLQLSDFLKLCLCDSSDFVLVRHA